MLEVWNYKFFAKDDGEADVYLDGDIVDAGTQAIYKEWFGDDSSVSYRSFRNQVLEKNPRTLNVYINSYGGMVYDALAMHDFLKELQAKGVTVNTKVRGIAASAATFVALAGGSVEMSENSIFMIHNASGSIWGSIDEIEKFAITMRKLNDQIVNLYVGRTGMKKEEVQALMDAETHLTATEAKEKGFIDKVTGAVEFENRIKPEQWAFKDRTVLNFFNKQVKNSDMTADDIKNTVSATVTKILKDLGVTKPENKGGTAPDQDTIGGQVVDKLIPVFQNRVTELENSVNTEKTAKEAAEAQVVTLTAKVADQGRQIVALQAQTGTPAPAGDPAPQGADKLTDEQKEDLKFENSARERMGIAALTEAEYIAILNPKTEQK